LRSLRISRTSASARWIRHTVSSVDALSTTTTERFRHVCRRRHARHSSIQAALFQVTMHAATEGWCSAGPSAGRPDPASRASLPSAASAHSLPAPAAPFSAPAFPVPVA